MEKVMAKELLVQIDTDGFYTYDVADVESLSLRVEANAHVEVCFTLKGELDFHSEMLLGAGVEAHILVVNECVSSKEKFHFALARDAKLRLGFYELKENSVDLSAQVDLIEEGADVDITTSSISSSKKQFAISCVHQAPHTYSNLKNFEISKQGSDYKLDAGGEIVKGAYGSKMHQASRVLTTHEDQSSEVIPSLLIDENDVEASHACSMGKMDENYLYYLQSRGIDEAKARELLTLSYLLPISDVIDDEKTKEMLTMHIRSRAGL